MLHFLTFTNTISSPTERLQLFRAYGAFPSPSHHDLCALLTNAKRDASPTCFSLIEDTAERAGKEQLHNPVSSAHVDRS
jgi:hypothetical protein